jgi:Skp family chaperone for outer membrane proteins
MTLEFPAIRSMLIALAALCIALPATSSTAAAQQAQPTKVATANMQRIFNELQETKDLNAKWANEGNNFKAQDTEKKAKIRDLEAARDALKSDSPAYEQKNQEWMNAVIEYQAWAQTTNINRMRMQNLQTVQLFNKIQTAVAEVATQRGLDLVLAEQRAELPENAQNMKVEEVRALIASRNILYMNPNVDITADVIANLDAKYKSGK